MKRTKWLAALLGVMLMAALLTLSASAAEHTHCICGKHDCTDATHEKITYIPWSEAIKDTTLIQNGVVQCDVHVYLDEDTTLTNNLSFVDSKNPTLDLCLNGCTLDMNGMQILLGYPNNYYYGEFNLSDCGTAGKITGASNSVVEIKNGIFTMYSGAIADNDFRAIFIKRYNSNSTAKANILGGKISGNRCETGTSPDGGAVLIHNGDLHIGGMAEISENTARDGGAIATYPYGSSVRISISIDGKAVIKKNIATRNGGAISNLYGDSYATVLNATLAISDDVEIIENTAMWGGALYTIKADVTISDNVEITDNRSKEFTNSTGKLYYSNVYFSKSGGTFKIADNVKIYNNYLDNTTTQLNVSLGNTTYIDLSALGANAQIGVYCANNKFPTPATPTIGVSTSTPTAATGAEYRVWSDDAQYVIVRGTNGVLQMTTPPASVTVTFDAQGGTVSPETMDTTNGRLSSLPTPTKSGAFFDGWYTDLNDANTVVNAKTVYPTATTLYAKWTECDHIASTAKPTCDSDATCSVCGGTIPALDHSWDTTAWKTDETNHWYPCTRCTAKKDETPHSGWTTEGATDGKHKCGTCDYETPHSYSTDWDKNETHHWHACTACGAHDAATKAPHAGGTATCSGGALCPTCNQEYGAINPDNHDFAEEWTQTDTKHYHVCSRCLVYGSEADHDYDDACDTDCNTCGYIRTITHTYTDPRTSDTEHWTLCAVCGHEQPGSREPHDYDDQYDPDCNTCGATRSVPMRWTLFPVYRLTFDTAGGSTIATQLRMLSNKVDLTRYTPTREGYTFAGWFADPGCTVAITEPFRMRGNRTVYAGWIETVETEPAA